MWALLDIDNKTVLSVIPPDQNPEEIAQGRTYIEMTLENSPGWVGGTYIDGKFYPPYEIN